MAVCNINNEEALKSLSRVVGTLMRRKADVSENFTLKDIALEVYNIVLKNSKDEVLALGYAELTPRYFMQFVIVEPKLKQFQKDFIQDANDYNLLNSATTIESIKDYLNLLPPKSDGLTKEVVGNLEQVKTETEFQVYEDVRPETIRATTWEERAISKLNEKDPSMAFYSGFLNMLEANPALITRYPGINSPIMITTMHGSQIAMKHRYPRHQRSEADNTASVEIKPGVEKLFDSNPELANAVYEALGFKGNINLESNLKNTGKTEQELIEYLKQKYPEIKLDVTNNPVWKKGDNIFNQTIENEMGEEYWKALYSNKTLSNREEFESVRIPTIKNKYKPDYENVYHGTNVYDLDNEGNLILISSHNFANKTESISLTQIPVVAQDYMLRKKGNIIIKINNKALPSNYTVESAEEIAINGNKPFVVKKGMFEIIEVQTLAEKMKIKYAYEVNQKAEELRSKLTSDLDLLDNFYAEQIDGNNYAEIQEYENDSLREKAPDWYVADEYLDVRAARKAVENIKVTKDFVIKGIAQRILDNIKKTGKEFTSLQEYLPKVNTIYGTPNSPHGSTLIDSLLDSLGLGFFDTYYTEFNTDEEIKKRKLKTKEVADLFEAITKRVVTYEKEALDFFNSDEEKQKRAEQKRIYEENYEYLPKYKEEFDDLPFQRVKDKIVGQANIKAMTVLVDAVNKKADTIPHEYAHHYIAWFRNSSIVQEGIKRFGSEEALVQAIGEQVVIQEGEVYNWWKKFTNWLLDLLSDKQLLQILTDSFLNRQDLNDFTYNQITPQQKQQALQVYSQYLDTGKQDIEGFKEFVGGKQTDSTNQFDRLYNENVIQTITNETGDILYFDKDYNIVDQSKGNPIYFTLRTRENQVSGEVTETELQAIKEDMRWIKSNPGENKIVNPIIDVRPGGPAFTEIFTKLSELALPTRSKIEYSTSKKRMYLNIPKAPSILLYNANIDQPLAEGIASILVNYDNVYAVRNKVQLKNSYDLNYLLRDFVQPYVNLDQEGFKIIKSVDQFGKVVGIEVQVNGKTLDLSNKEDSKKEIVNFLITNKILFKQNFKDLTDLSKLEYKDDRVIVKMDNKIKYEDFIKNYLTTNVQVNKDKKIEFWNPYIVYRPGERVEDIGTMDFGPVSYPTTPPPTSQYVGKQLSLFEVTDEQVEQKKKDCHK
jgi:hypothetical protein